MLARPGQGRLHQERGQVDAGGNPVVAGTQESTPRSVVGPVVPRGHLVEEATGLLFTGQHVVGRHQVIVVLVGQRANDRVAIGTGRQVRQVFADAVTGNLCGDRIEVTPDLGGRPGFHVERLVVTGRAGQEHDHDLFRRARHSVGGRFGRSCRRGCPTGQCPGHPQPQQARITDLEKFATCGLWMLHRLFLPSVTVIPRGRSSPTRVSSSAGRHVASSRRFRQSQCRQQTTRHRRPRSRHIPCHRRSPESRLPNWPSATGQSGRPPPRAA